MNEGVFRVLVALGDGGKHSHSELVRRSGEAPTTVREVLERHPEWIRHQQSWWQATRRGMAALGREMVQRRVAPEMSDQAFADWFEDVGARRGEPKTDIDQVYATTDTVYRRAKRLVEAGEQQRGLIFLGDDDLTSLAVHKLGGPRKVVVVDVDADILRVIHHVSEEEGWEHSEEEHDLCEPLPRRPLNKYGCVFTDPPYAIEGFTLFVSRAIELLKPDGRLYVCFGQARRASERGLQKQRVLAEAGLLLEEVLPEFNRYEGAETIGATSALWIARVTPQSKPIVRGQIEGPIYSKRSVVK